MAIVINMSDEYGRIIASQRVIYLALSVFNPVAKRHWVRRDQGLLIGPGTVSPGCGGFNGALIV